MNSLYIHLDYLVYFCECCAANLAKKLPLFRTDPHRSWGMTMRPQRSRRTKFTNNGWCHLFNIFRLHAGASSSQNCVDLTLWDFIIFLCFAEPLSCSLSWAFSQRSFCKCSSALPCLLWALAPTMDSSQVADLWPTCWLCKLMQIVTPNCDILWHHVTSCGSNCHQMSPRYLKYCQWVHEPASHIATVQISCNSINWEVQLMNGPKKHMPISVSFVKSLCFKIVWPNLPFHIHHRGDEHESRWLKFFFWS